MAKSANWLVVAGPVIVHQGSVLLVKEQKTDGLSPWMFPGGEVEDADVSFEATAEREGKEETGLTLHITKPLKSVLLHRGAESVALIHFLAKRADDADVIKGPGIMQAVWFDLHNLPPDCAPNVAIVIKDYLVHLWFTSPWNLNSGRLLRGGNLFY